MTTKEVLIAARRVIEKPENWGKGAFARDARGEEVFHLDPDACQFCLVGAARRVASDKTSQQVVLALLKALPEPYYNVTFFNDDPRTTHEMVLACIDRAIAACGK